ncbi:DEAD/DEAH box helicase [Aquibacillus koreensis]|uniref:DEAD/DEAH box helicase n=1 Tax=Aquibacillus koreensis TaxID=279446 RepID=UPI002FEE3D26
MHTVLNTIGSFLYPTFDWIPTSTYDRSSTETEIHAKQFSGKLLLREEIPLEENLLNQLLSTDLMTTIPSIEKYIWGHRCRRCGNKAKHLFATIPCSRCGTTHVYCRKCIEMGRVMSCSPLYYWTGPQPLRLEQSEPCSWQGELTSHQQKASNEIEKTMMTEAVAELLVWAVCGAGKTEMLFQGINEAIRRGKRVCLATPRADVVRELYPRFTTAFPNTTIEALYGGSEQKKGEGQLILATTHQLLRFAHAFDVVIIDEIDAFPYHADPSLPFASNRAAKPNASLIYLTATPRKKHRNQVQSKQLKAVFVPVRFHGHPLPVPKLHMCFSLKKSLTKFEAPQAFYQWYERRMNPKRQLLIFVPVIALAEKITLSLRDNALFSRETITSVHASDEDRKEKVQAFRDRKLSVLVTTTILERGVTFPSVDVAVLDACHDVFDEAALVQIAGRAGRSPDDPTGEVIFFHDGKTDAMVAAVDAIKQMNKRGRNL